MLVCLSLWPGDEPETCPGATPPSAQDSWDRPQECRRSDGGWTKGKIAHSPEVSRSKETRFSWLVMIAQLSGSFWIPRSKNVVRFRRSKAPHLSFQNEKISCQGQTGSAFDGGKPPFSLANLEPFNRYALGGGGKASAAQPASVSSLFSLMIISS